MTLEELEESGISLPPNIDSNVYTQIFYSLNFSLETLLQQQDRIHRLGQEHDCEYYKLISNSPIEQHIIKRIDEKQTIRKEMLIDFVKAKAELMV